MSVRKSVGAFRAWWLTFGLAAAGCAGPREGLETSSLPNEVQGDYEVFAQRCSKCHSLGRPLNSGITDDAWWNRYVTRMRRMPGSGISHEDEAPILRFLHWYSTEQTNKKPAGSASVSAWGPASASEAAR
jgi:hypothetical protein